jgi:dUTP pyrophosphatase
MTTMVYLAEPIDQSAANAILARVGESSSHLTASSIEHHLRAHKAITYRPATAWRIAGGTEPDGRVERTNRAALELSDAMIAVLPAGYATIGVPMEIEMALQRQIPVVVVTEVSSFSLARPGVTVVRDWQSAAAAALSAVDTGAQVDREGSFVPSGPRRRASDHPAGHAMPVVVGEGGQLPTRAYPDDAGLDLYVSEDAVILPGQFQDIHCAVRVELPYWSWGLIIARSSTLRQLRLQVIPAVIDTGWRGELLVGVINTDQDAHVKVKAGYRLAQLIILDNGTRSVTPVQATELSVHPRGNNGFGSTGS